MPENIESNKKHEETPMKLLKAMDEETQADMLEFIKNQGALKNLSPEDAQIPREIQK